MYPCQDWGGGAGSEGKPLQKNQVQGAGSFPLKQLPPPSSPPHSWDSAQLQTTHAHALTREPWDSTTAHPFFVPEKEKREKERDHDYYQNRMQYEKGIRGK